MTSPTLCSGNKSSHLLFFFFFGEEKQCGSQIIIKRRGEPQSPYNSHDSVLWFYTLHISVADGWFQTPCPRASTENELHFPFCIKHTWDFSVFTRMPVSFKALASRQAAKKKKKKGGFLSLHQHQKVSLLTGRCDQASDEIIFSCFHMHKRKRLLTSLSSHIIQSLNQRGNSHRRRGAGGANMLTQQLCF